MEPTSIFIYYTELYKLYICLDNGVSLQHLYGIVKAVI